MGSKQPAVQPKARVVSKSHSRTIEVKAMLRAVMEHRPFGAKTQAEKTAAWARIAEAVWEGDAPKFDVQAVFAKLMAFPSSDQRNFVGWDEEMYQLRTRLVEAYAIRSTPADSGKRARTPVETSSAEPDAADRGGVNREDREAPAPEVPSGGDGERYSKRIRVRRATITDDDGDDGDDALREEEEDESGLLEEEKDESASREEEDGASSDDEEATSGGDQDDEDEWAGEMNGTGDAVYNWYLAQAIVKFHPHKDDDTDAAWASVMAWLREKGYPRTLTVEALKRQFGTLLNALAVPTEGEDPKVGELRARLVRYCCESAAYFTGAMKNFVQSASPMPADPQLGGLRRSARAQRHANAPEPPLAAHTDRKGEAQTRRPSRPTVARSTGNMSELEAQCFNRTMASFDSMERHRNEELLSILQTYRLKGPDGKQR